MNGSKPSSVRRIDISLAREVQRRNEYPDPSDLQTRCEDIYGWMPQYAKEIVKEMWEELYAPATAEEVQAMERKVYRP